MRRHGAAGPTVVALHGGPGAPGSMAPLARVLADQFVVLEPLQRPSGGEPLTVARHVADLHELVESLGGDVRPALVGSSWGAMLALAYAARYPERTAAIVAIGSGTFDLAARARMHEILDDRRALDFDASYTFERCEGGVEAADSDDEGAFDARANQETWNDMLRLQAAGVYPAAFAAIDVPVLMLHGAYDPHPGTMIRDGLTPFIPQLEYREWERCGHYPWLEKHARDDFYRTLRAWLHAHAR
ncbi:MAG: alpha/beta hydrolase [Myxococcales bacterium]|nr:alpha/beta hydrolase [Myxococcales bacterium]